jgi:glycine C-acetyltransferase
LFSTGLTPADTAAAIAAVDVLLESDALVRKLWGNAAYFRVGMNEAGFDTGRTEPPITPVMLGDEQLTSEFSKMLYDEAIFASAIKYPTVAKGKARIRCMLSAAHKRRDLDFAIEKFVKVGKALGVVK